MFLPRFHNGKASPQPNHSYLQNSRKKSKLFSFGLVTSDQEAPLATYEQPSTWADWLDWIAKNFRLVLRKPGDILPYDHQWICEYCASFDRVDYPPLLAFWSHVNHCHPQLRVRQPPGFEPARVYPEDIPGNERWSLKFNLLNLVDDYRDQRDKMGNVSLYQILKLAERANLHFRENERKRFM